MKKIIQLKDRYNNNIYPVSLKDPRYVAKENWNNIKAMFLDRVYPVGAIFISTNGTNPSNFIGGQWEQVKDRFLLGAGDVYTAGNIGGEERHQLTINEMPSHTHKLGRDPDSTASARSGRYTIEKVAEAQGFFNTSETGGNQPHENMPPYLTVYIWKRVG